MLRLKNALFVVLGFALLGLGLVGALLPVMPTVPFVLLAAMCFSSSSKKFYERLRRNRFFGPYIENYYSKRGITKRRKIAGIVLAWAGLGVSMFVMRKTWVYIIAGIVGAGITLHFLLIKTRKSAEEPSRRKQRGMNYLNTNKGSI